MYNRNGVINNDELIVEYRFDSTEDFTMDNGFTTDYFVDYSGNQNHGDNFSVETIAEQPAVGCSDVSACNLDNSNMGNESCFYSSDYGWCDCDGNVLDACGVCGGDGSSCADNVVYIGFDPDGTKNANEGRVDNEAHFVDIDDNVNDNRKHNNDNSDIFFLYLYFLNG